MNLEPDTPEDKALEVVEKVVKRARILDGIAERLIEELQQCNVESKSAKS